MKYMLIGFSILGIFVNINFAANDAIHLIASRGVVPYFFIRESQTQSLQASRKNASERKIRSPHSLTLESISTEDRDTLMEPVIDGLEPFEDSPKYLDAAFLENTERIVSPLDSPKSSFPIPIVRRPVADREEEELGAESLIELSISPGSCCRLHFLHLSLEPASLSPMLAEDEEGIEELLNREVTELDFSSSDDDIFSSKMEWVRVETPQSQDSEGQVPAVAVRRPSATVTFTRTNVVTEVQFGSLHSRAFVRGNPVGPAPATPINTVPRPLRPSTRTHEGRLKEAQINHMFPIQFGINPRTREECVVLVQRRQECLTPIRPVQSRDLTSTPSLTTDQADHTFPRHLCVSVQESSVFETCVGEVPAQTMVEESQEIET